MHRVRRYVPDVHDTDCVHPTGLFLEVTGAPKFSGDQDGRRYVCCRIWDGMGSQPPSARRPVTCPRGSVLAVCARLYPQLEAAVREGVVGSRALGTSSLISGPVCCVLAGPSPRLPALDGVDAQTRRSGHADLGSETRFLKMTPKLLCC